MAQPVIENIKDSGFYNTKEKLVSILQFLFTFVLNT